MSTYLVRPKFVKIVDDQRGTWNERKITHFLAMKGDIKWLSCTLENKFAEIRKVQKHSVGSAERACRIVIYLRLHIRIWRPDSNVPGPGMCSGSSTKGIT